MNNLHYFKSDIFLSHLFFQPGYPFRDAAPLPSLNNLVHALDDVVQANAAVDKVYTEDCLVVLVEQIEQFGDGPVGSTVDSGRILRYQLSCIIVWLFIFYYRVRYFL